MSKWRDVDFVCNDTILSAMNNTIISDATEFNTSFDESTLRLCSSEICRWLHPFTCMLSAGCLDVNSCHLFAACRATALGPWQQMLPLKRANQTFVVDFSKLV